jgi:hypothetical protein
MHLVILLFDLAAIVASLWLFVIAWRSQGPQILPIAATALAAGLTQLIVFWFS